MVSSAPLCPQDIAESRPTLFCCGAQGAIFGSCYLLDTCEKKIVLDCGLFSEPEKQKNNFYFPFDPKKADAAVISHVHADHIGKLPLLYRKGFKGVTYCTAPTKAMSGTAFAIMNMIRDETIIPYGSGDIEKTLEHIKSLDVGEWHALGKKTKLRLINTGHIIGAVMIEIVFEWEGKEYTFLYACDTRNRHSPLTPTWENVKRADWVVIESVYGNRDHGDFEQEFEKFTDLMNEAIISGGTILIPAYSIDRTQKMLYFIYKLRSEGKLRRRVDVYVDSRVANRITADHVDYWEYLGKPIQDIFKRRVNPFEFRGVHKGAPPENKRGSKIIIAPSAFCDEGTSIVKHVKKYVGDPNSVVIFTGFVLPESIGGQILAGKGSVEMGGEKYPVRCNAYRVSAFSGHADRSEIIRWFKGFERVGAVLVVHGLPEGSAGLAKELHDELGLKTYVPQYRERVDLMGLLEPTPTPAAATQSAKP